MSTFAPRFGYVADDLRPKEAKLTFAVERAPSAYDSGFRSPMLVQNFSDCVPRSVAKAHRRRMILQDLRKPLDQRRDPSTVPLPSSRWGYWQWLEATGRLGRMDSGTQPEMYVNLLRERGWCSEEHMPYALADGTVPDVDEANAPSLLAYKFSVDQRRRIRAHFIDPRNRNELCLAIAHDLGVCVAIACDERFVAPGGIPDDPNYVWDFDPELSEVGRHMMEVDAYDERGILCSNTWGVHHAHAGRVRIGWKTMLDERRADMCMAIDHSDMPSDA